RFADGTVGEIFLTSGKCGSDSDTAARDSAVVASIALWAADMPSWQRAAAKYHYDRAGRTTIVEIKRENMTRAAKRSPSGAPGHSITAPTEMPWPMMSRDAYYGLAGDVVEQIEPHTEADPV